MLRQPNIITPALNLKRSLHIFRAPLTLTRGFSTPRRLTWTLQSAFLQADREIKRFNFEKHKVRNVDDGIQKEGVKITYVKSTVKRKVQATKTCKPLGQTWKPQPVSPKRAAVTVAMAADDEAMVSEKADAPGLGQAVASEEGDPIFFDTKKTKVDLKELNESGSKVGHSTAGEPETAQAKNRDARRRLKLIRKEKEKIQERFGVEVGSTEPHEQVDQQLALWIEKRDAQTERNESRRKSVKKARRIRFMAKKNRKALSKAEKGT